MSPLIESCTGPGPSYTKCILCKWSVKAINLVHSAIIKNVSTTYTSPAQPHLAPTTQPNHVSQHRQLSPLSKGIYLKGNFWFYQNNHYFMREKSWIWHRTSGHFLVLTFWFTLEILEFENQIFILGQITRLDTESKRDLL